MKTRSSYSIPHPASSSSSTANFMTQLLELTFSQDNIVQKYIPTGKGRISIQRKQLVSTVQYVGRTKHIHIRDVSDSYTHLWSPCCGRRRRIWLLSLCPACDMEKK